MFANKIVKASHSQAQVKEREQTSDERIGREALTQRWEVFSAILNLPQRLFQSPLCEASIDVMLEDPSSFLVIDS